MSAATPQAVLEIDNGIARIALNRPDALNAITVAMAQDLLHILRQLESDDRVRVVVIQGRGRAFCAGGDLSFLNEASPEQLSTLIAPLHESIEIISRLGAPVVACVHGVVAGAGVSLALACDFVLAGEGTRFNLAYTAIGTSPDASASWHLPRLVGLNKSLELLLLSEPFDAVEALNLRLVNTVLPADQLQEASETLITRLASAPTVALAQTKRLVRSSLQSTLTEQLQAEHDSFQACARTRDFKTGINAFLHKSKPAFEGL